MADKCGCAGKWLDRCVGSIAQAIDAPVGARQLPCLQDAPVGLVHPRGEKRMRRIDEGLAQHCATDQIAATKCRSAARAARGT
eukprot:1184936-Pyramimonas_sp.AAC.1